MTRVLHTGDTHVGYQQYHHPRRRRDFLRGFEAVIEDAIAEDVDAVVHAGDLFHDRRPGLQDLQGVVAALRDLRAAEIPFLAIVGNHEAKRSGQWLDLFADLDLAERLDDEPRVVGPEGESLALYGLDHVPESQRDGLDYEFADHDAERSALVAHGLFGPFDPAEWDTEALLEDATVDFDAMLLGDNHDPGKQQVDDTWVTYPGSTERASASERADRGYNLVTVDDGDLRITRRTLQTREFVFVDVELTEGEGADVVRDRVREFDHEDAVTIVTIEGDGEPISPGPIEEIATERGAIVARVNDRREHEEADDELEVSFADPDEAVRQRVREMGLSTAARDLDRVVRDGSVADANVRETTRRRVEEHRETGLDTFEPVPSEEIDEPTADSGAESDDGAEQSEPDQPLNGSATETATLPAADASAAGDAVGSDIATDQTTTGQAATGVTAAEPDQPDDVADDAGTPAEATTNGVAPSDSADADSNADPETDADPEDGTDPVDDAGTTDDTDVADSNDPADDGQASMEEYL